MNSRQKSFRRRSSGASSGWVRRLSIGSGLSSSADASYPTFFRRSSCLSLEESEITVAAPGGDGEPMQQQQRVQKESPVQTNNEQPPTSDFAATAVAVTDDEEAQLAFQNNKKKILILRVMMVFTLVAAATTVAALCYHFTSKFETDLFHQQYEAAATLFMENFQDRVSDKIYAAKTFSGLYTSRFGPVDTWPNATMPDFQEQAEGQLWLANGRALSFNPLVTNGTMRHRWEAHAAENAHVMDSDQLINRLEGGRIVSDGIFRVVDKKKIDDPGVVSGNFPDVLVPVWQIAPIVENEAAVMFNLKSVGNRQRALDDMMTHKITTLTDLLQLVQDDEIRPSSILFYPVFDRFNTDGSTTGRNVVGSISIVFSWDDVFRGSLPTYVRGVTCVLETNSGKSFTFSIGQGRSVLVGGGDLHETEYDDMEQSVTASLEGSDDDLGRANDLVTYSVRIYPSSELEGIYLSNMPVVYTAVVLMVFFVTSATFLFYDILVRNRTHRVTQAAVRSHRVVDSLFPNFIRHRYMNAVAAGEGESGAGLDESSGLGKGETIRGVAAVESTSSSVAAPLNDSGKKNDCSSHNVDGEEDNPQAGGDVPNNPQSGASDKGGATVETDSNCNEMSSAVGTRGRVTDGSAPGNFISRRASLKASRKVVSSSSITASTASVGSSANGREGVPNGSADASYIEKKKMMADTPAGRMKEFFRTNRTGHRKRRGSLSGAFSLAASSLGAGNWGSGVSEGQPGSQSSSAVVGGPIADVFSSVTVIFADLVGFTSWSSRSPPEQVFQLLERMFAEFDELASRFGVFKVSTIWDCYMAVTGLPDPQPDHAVRMCRFAMACRARFLTIRKEMEEDLGPPVRKLEIRIGCHSGEVTAGVLRGQKSGFTIFGDTVNTASRMESTGKSLKIQVSATTAELLTEDGFDYWLTEREDRVQPKGKGEMQTFWVDEVLVVPSEDDISDGDRGDSGGKKSEEKEDTQLKTLWLPGPQQQTPRLTKELSTRTVGQCE